MTWWGAGEDIDAAEGTEDDALDFGDDEEEAE